MRPGEELVLFLFLGQNGLLSGFIFLNVLRGGLLIFLPGCLNHASHFSDHLSFFSIFKMLPSLMLFFLMEADVVSKRCWSSRCLSINSRKYHWIYIGYPYNWVFVGVPSHEFYLKSYRSSTVRNSWFGHKYFILWLPTVIPSV